MTLRKTFIIPYFLVLILASIPFGVSGKIINSQITVVLTPAPPTDLSAHATSATQVNLSWTDNSTNESGFKIERKTGAGGTYSQIATTTSNIATYSDVSVSANTTYYYRVRAYSSDGNSIYSDEVGVTTPTTGISGGGSGGGGSGGGGGGYPVTAASFQGIGYPFGTVYLLKDAQLVATTTANEIGEFEFGISNLSSGIYSFSIWEEDTNRNRSLTIGFNISIVSGVTNLVSGIFLPPIIAIDKSEVKKGDFLTIYGQSAALANINLLINSSNTLYKDTKADANGLWEYKFNTDEVELGDHTTRAKALKGVNTSNYSQPIGFIVGSRNVSTQPISKCPQKGDLNNDCRVNLVDFSIAAYWWKRPLTDRAKIIVDQKLYPDGVVNLRDFSVMAYYWTG